ncbi:MAG: PilZ domain-containing protein [Desulfofustis sp.]|nr:PilZ domain-containing protein [Desulfofustis sp.]
MPTTPDERRRHKRHKLENSVSVSTHGIFQIIDISRGGFRFICPPYTSVPDSWETDILTSASSLFGLPAERAWVSMSERGNQEYLPTVVGAKFGRLTQEQETLLTTLIESIVHGQDTEH